MFICFHSTLKAQNGIQEISGVEVSSYERMIDSIHYSYDYYNYPQLVRKLVFISKIAENEHSNLLIVLSKYYRADIFYKAHRYREAKKVLEETFKLNIPIDARESLYPYDYYLYLNILIGLKEYDLAKNIIKEKALFEEEPRTLERNLRDLIKAKLLFADGDFENSLLLLDSIEERVENYPCMYLLSEVYYLKSLIFKQQSDFENAILYATKNLDHTIDSGFVFLELQTLDLLANIYKETRNKDKQIEFLSKANSLKASILNFQQEEFTEEKNLKSTSINSAVKTILELSSTNLQQQKSLKYNQLAIILSILFIVILSLFTVSLYKNNNLRKRANQLLYKKNKDLVESREKTLAATKYREQFLSTITHELRTPIYAVTGLTYLLLKEDPTEKQTEYLKSLKYSGEHLLSLINNVLDINKLELNKVESVKFDFYIKPQLNNTLSTLERAARENNVELHLEIDPQIPKLLNGDMIKISQVIINLVSNAIKFSKNGDVWVRLKLVKESSKQVKIKFEVEDNGRGIPKDMHQAIFEKFNQGADRINANYGGTGLGLPIVKNLLEFLKSEIHLESELGSGSKFYFTVNLNKVLKKDVITSGIRMKEEDFDDQNFQKVFDNKKVLVVEDNKLNQKITCKILEKKNLFCDIANNGEEAVSLAQKNKYDIILMDIHMPVMDGIEAIKIIRENKDETPIIALTAVNVSEEINDFLLYGFNDVIPKPYKTEMFYEKIYKAIVSNPNNFEANS
ncbi:hypothetical protein SAMN04488096_10614 [Mesonia phycicola]|uniref:histidine kinase n=1 Tax=Mesonia phycicola TaxID=579105 RepID=A0A1M6F9G7_9FLAO|nr:ATP-binding protein [Mesonia phycicola]SHI94249.1 hypothetical protein SAMN04488096_10614 [Mesonia phycicola]